MSLQQYFQEQGFGHAKFDKDQMTLNSPNKAGSMKFPFHKQNNHSSLFQISEKDLNVLCDIPNVLTYVAD